MQKHSRSTKTEQQLRKWYKIQLTKQQKKQKRQQISKKRQKKQKKAARNNEICY